MYGSLLIPANMHSAYNKLHRYSENSEVFVS